MRLAPGVFVRANVCRFRKIVAPGFSVVFQIVDFHKNPVRCARVHVAGVVVRIGFDPGKKP